VATSSPIAGEAEVPARQGSELVAAVSADLDRAVATATESLQLIDGLGERIHEVGTIAATINQIAGRTKLLVLNAAIEAAHAGEHGRGFSVVADAVGELAPSTSAAATMIGGIVRAIQRTSTESSTESEAIWENTSQRGKSIERAAKAGAAFAQIVTDIEQLNSIIAGVATTGAQQAQVAQQLQTTAGAITVAARSTVRSGQRP
jgi:methyl-accepting chemotaxis protein